MPHNDPAALKLQLRAQFRNQRQRIPELERQQLDQRLRQHLHERLAPCRRLGAFLGFDGEPQLRPWLQSLVTTGSTEVYLPCIEPFPNGGLAFRQWATDQPLYRNAWGIEEPLDGIKAEVRQLDALLIPLVAWDRSGTRLGMGKGFYDKALEPVALQARPKRIGVSYAAQEHEQLPSQPWDVRLHSIVTEHGWFTCSG